MLLFALFAFAIFAGVAGALMQRKNTQQSRKMQAEAFNQDSVPKANFGDVKGVLFGTDVIDGANTITSGNFQSGEVYIETDDPDATGGGKGGGGK